MVDMVNFFSNFNNESLKMQYEFMLIATKGLLNKMKLKMNEKDIESMVENMVYRGIT